MTSVKGQKNKQCGKYPCSIAPEDGRWVTSRICDPSEKMTPTFQPPVSRRMFYT